MRSPRQPALPRAGLPRRWPTAALLALVTGCAGRRSVDSTPLPVTSPQATLSPTPQPSSPPPGDCGPPPTVAIDRPREGQRLTSSPVTVQASASSSVIRVEYLYHVDSRGLARGADPPVFIGGSSQPPFQVQWNLPSLCDAGVSLLAIATDLCGNVRDSGALHVSICH